MEIVAADLSKRFNKHIIFEGINLSILPKTKLAILGPNGSGKSTLIKCLCGYTLPSKGKLSLTIKEKEIETFSPYISIAAPYSGLIEEFTLIEMINFYTKFKPLKNDISTSSLLEIMGLEKHRNKFIKQFSSGMKQRVKISLALFADVPFVFLDEPTSNFDDNSVSWYQNTIDEHATNQALIIGSNQQEIETQQCNQKLIITDYKPTN